MLLLIWMEMIPLIWIETLNTLWTDWLKVMLRNATMKKMPSAACQQWMLRNAKIQ
ncbi:MAG: hypothetical protein IMY68_05110 [Bacteroidetes bacterium]|nr:hypothetical protein [Bacteroidota bacterium]